MPNRLYDHSRNERLYRICDSASIGQKAVSDVEILKIADVDYTGKAVRPSLFVKADGNMIKSSDYTVTYYNNTNVGTATAVVTLGENYESRYPVSTTFKIVLGKPTGFKATADSATSVKSLAGTRSAIANTGFIAMIQRKRPTSV